MQLVSLARNPIPSGAIVGSVSSQDGVALRFARWDATRQPTRGTVCLFPGRGEFIEKYFETISDLRRRGFAVAALDWRGQGGSQRLLPNPRKGHVARFSDYDGDLVQFMKQVVLPDCPPPFVAMAHSMGGNILLRQATVAGNWFERIVACAPMIAFDDHKVPIPQGLAKFLVNAIGIGPLARLYVPGGSDMPEERKAFEGNALTRDRERFTRNRMILEAAPELALGSPTLGWVKAAYRSSQQLQNPSFATSVQVPILLIAAGHDRIVSSPAIHAFAERLKVGARVVIAGSEHEILQERDDIRGRFWAAFDAYLGVGATVA